MWLKENLGKAVSKILISMIDSDMITATLNCMKMFWLESRAHSCCSIPMNGSKGATEVSGILPSEPSHASHNHAAHLGMTWLFCTIWKQIV